MFSPFTMGILLVGFLFVPIGIAALIWMIRSPWVFVTLLLLYTPFEEFFVKWFPLGLQKYLRYVPEVALVGISTLVIMLAWEKRRKIFWIKNPVDLPLLFFLAVVLLSALINSVPYFVVFASLKNLLRYAFLYYLILFIDIDIKSIRRLLYLLVAVASIQAGLGVFEMLGGAPVASFLRSNVTGFELLSGTENILSGLAKSKPSGTVGLYSSYGVYLVFWSIFILVDFYRTKQKKYLFLYGLMFAAVIISRARTSWVLYILSFYLCTFLVQRRLFLRLMNVTIVGIIVAFATGLAGNWIVGQNPEVLGRMSLLGTYGDFGFRPESIVQRFNELLSPDYWRNASRVVTLTITLPEILKHYPYLGLGPGTMASAVTGGGSTSIGLFPAYSHENWLNVPTHIAEWAADTGFIALIAQFGVLGLLCWLSIFIQFLWISWKLVYRSKTAFVRYFAVCSIAVILLVYFVSGFVGDYITYRSVGIYIWFMLAILQNLWRSHLRESGLSVLKRDRLRGLMSISSRSVT